MYFYLLLIAQFISFNSLTSEYSIELESDFSYGKEHYKKYKYYWDYLYYIFKGPIEKHDYSISFTVKVEGHYETFSPYYLFSDMDLDERDLAYKISSFVSIYPIKYNKISSSYSFEINYEKFYANYCYLIFEIDGIEEGK